MKSNSFYSDLVSFITGDKERMQILKVVKSVDEHLNLWVAGGFVRNLVWDIKHNYQIKTELGDIDIFYFNKENISKAVDISLETRLHNILPNVNWSVKNQARMNIHNDELPYQDLSDALTRFPETASAVAVKLDKEEKIEILAPLGLDDLFNLIVRPTYLGKANPKTSENFNKRHIEKDWKKKWPGLIILN